MLSPTAIQVTWQAPKYTGNGIFSYEIHYNKSSADEIMTVAESVLRQEITNLRPYTYYKVQVAVKSDKLSGPMSFAKVVQTWEDGKCNKQHSYSDQLCLFNKEKLYKNGLFHSKNGWLFNSK